MKASLNVPRTEEEAAGNRKELKVDAEEKKYSKIKLRTIHLHAWKGAESSEEEPENNAMTRFFLQIRLFSFKFYPQARYETSAKAEEAGSAEEEP